ncbi:MAG TPA: hypothetical protein VEY50_00120 [Lysobacter sp.]|nr:hypothetical protein [Lysobacter sp.]
MAAFRLIRTVVLSGLLVAAAAGCAGTSRILMAEPRAPIPVEQVRIYHAPPARFVEIARIETASGIGFGTAGQTDAALLKLRREAARLGANGVLLEAVDTVSSPLSVGIGGGRISRNSAVGGSVGFPTAQRRAVGVAIVVDAD